MSTECQSILCRQKKLGQGIQVKRTGQTVLHFWGLIARARSWRMRQTTHAHVNEELREHI